MRRENNPFHGKKKLVKVKLYPKVNGVMCYLCAECGKVHAMFLDVRLEEHNQPVPSAFHCTSCKGLCGHMPSSHGLDRTFAPRELTQKGAKYFAYSKEGPVILEVK